MLIGKNQNGIAGGEIRSALSQDKEKSFFQTFICIVFALYIFLSFFEIYIQQYFGSINRFYILFMAGTLLLYFGFHISLNVYNICIGSWFLFKCLSILWSGGVNNREVSTHFASQIAVVILIVVLSGNVFDRKFLNWVIKSLLAFSTLYGVLSLFLSRAFKGTVTGRQVLTLFGVQNDPNNNAAFLIIAVSLALYSIIYEHRKAVLNAIIILINSYAILLTGSRTGFLSLVLVVGIAAFALPFFQKKDERKTKNALLTVMAFILLGILVIYLARDFLPTNILDRLMAFNEYEDGSGRAGRWEDALAFFYENPIFGKGWGGYALQGANEGGIHNTFLTNMCDVGIFGTILLIIPIAKVIILTIKKRDLLALIILIDGLFYALTLDAINKRFFWNAIYVSIMILNYDEIDSDPICVWYNRKERPTRKEISSKYIR